MIKLAIILPALLLAGCASPVQIYDEIGEYALPPGAQVMCGGHVSGEPEGKDKTGSHIIWKAYGSNSRVAEIVSFYQSQFGSAPKTLAANSFLWKPSSSGLHYSVQPAADAGPWDACRQQHANVQTVILISQRISTEYRD